MKVRRPLSPRVRARRPTNRWFGPRYAWPHNFSVGRHEARTLLGAGTSACRRIAPGSRSLARRLHLLRPTWSPAASQCYACSHPTCSARVYCCAIAGRDRSVPWENLGVLRLRCFSSGRICVRYLGVSAYWPSIPRWCIALSSDRFSKRGDSCIHHMALASSETCRPTRHCSRPSFAGRLSFSVRYQ